MLSESLRVPFRADDAAGTILVGSALTLLLGLLVVIWVVALAVSYLLGGVLTLLVVVPSLVMRGYLLSVVDAGITDAESAPSFIQWGSLVRTGWQSSLISAIYFIPGAVLCGLLGGGLAVTVISPPGFDGAMQALTGVLIMISGFGLLVYGLTYLYVRPAARAVFAATGSLRTAVGVRRVLRLALTADYLSGWLIAMGLLLIGPTVVLPLFVLAVAISVLSPILAAVVMLVTVFVGIGLLFVSRIAAAWATGRGAVDGLDRLYSVVPTNPEADDEDETRGDSLTHRGEPEAAAAVQIGRTVGDNPEPQPSHPAESTQPTDAEARSTASRGDESTADDTGAATESMSPDNGSTDRNSSEDISGSDEGEFVWGVDDEQ